MRVGSKWCGGCKWCESAGSKWVSYPFIRSVIQAVIRALILSCHFISISTAICTFVGVRNNLKISLSLDLADIPVGHWCLVAVFIFRNFRPSTARQHWYFCVISPNVALKTRHDLPYTFSHFVWHGFEHFIWHLIFPHFSMWYFSIHSWHIVGHMFWHFHLRYILP
jgi:hypothetical protein